MKRRESYSFCAFCNSCILAAITTGGCGDSKQHESPAAAVTVSQDDTSAADNVHEMSASVSHAIVDLSSSFENLFAFESGITVVYVIHGDEVLDRYVTLPLSTARVVGGDDKFSHGSMEVHHDDGTVRYFLLCPRSLYDQQKKVYLEFDTRALRDRLAQRWDGNLKR